MEAVQKCAAFYLHISFTLFTFVGMNGFIIIKSYEPLILACVKPEDCNQSNLIGAIKDNHVSVIERPNVSVADVQFLLQIADSLEGFEINKSTTYSR